MHDASYIIPHTSYIIVLPHTTYHIPHTSHITHHTTYNVGYHIPHTTYNIGYHIPHTTYYTEEGCWYSPFGKGPQKVALLLAPYHRKAIHRCYLVVIFFTSGIISFPQIEYTFFVIKFTGVLCLPPKGIQSTSSFVTHHQSSMLLALEWLLYWGKGQHH